MIKLTSDTRNRKIRDLFCFLAYFSLIVLTLCAYMAISKLWVPYGGKFIYKQLFTFEIPFILAISLTLFFFNANLSRKSNFFSAITAVMPILSIYIIYDVFYIYYERPFKLSDLNNLPDLYHGHIYLFFSLLFIILLIIVGMATSAYLWQTDQTRKRILTKFILRWGFLALILFMVISASKQICFIIGKHEDIAFISRNIKKNGRVASIIYYSQKQREARGKLINIDVNNLLKPFDFNIKKKRNVHIIILESLIDPRFIANIECDRPPIYEGMKEYLDEDMMFDLAISPVIGGHTAQSEFELLSGVPAMSNVSSIEFNVMDGSYIFSFINALRKNGYKTIATRAYEYNHYNSTLAYKSIGFEKVYTLAGIRKILKRDGAISYFDGDLLQHNLDYVDSEYISHDIPVLNYVLGIYGHIPYKRNKKIRPDIIECTVEGRHDKELNDIVQLFYYRTRAIYDFLKRLNEIDPDSITIIASDHLPYLGNGLKYIHNRKANIVLLLDKGKIKRLHIPNYYKIPYISMSLLLGKDIDANMDEKFLTTYYYQTMALGSGVISLPDSEKINVNTNH